MNLARHFPWPGTAEELKAAVEAPGAQFELFEPGNHVGPFNSMAELESFAARRMSGRRGHTSAAACLRHPDGLSGYVFVKTLNKPEPTCPACGAALAE